MSEMTARVRNRMQDVVINWQEKRFRRNDFRQQQADIHRARMTCSASMPSFQQCQTWNGSVSAGGRLPVMEKSAPKQRIWTGDGIRWDVALGALVLVGLLLTAMLLADLADIGSGGRNISKLNTSIRELEERNERIREEIALSADSASVCTEAVKLNLISSGGAKTVRLTAPVSAQLTLSTEAQAVENVELAGRMTSFAGE